MASVFGREFALEEIHRLLPDRREDRLLELPEQVQRCKLLVALGEAQCKAGDVPKAMATFQRAADLARSLGLPQDLADEANLRRLTDPEVLALAEQPTHGPRRLGAR